MRINNNSLDDVFSNSALQTLQVEDIGQEIENALGISVDNIQSSEVVLVTLLIDDSRSISSAGNEQHIRDGYNLVLESLRASQSSDDVLLHVRYLNGSILYPYCLLDNADEMDENNYSAYGSTPLYDQTMIMLATVAAKVAEFADAGVPARSISLIITDGADYGSVEHRASDVSGVMGEFLAQEMNIVAAMGVSDGHTDFRRVFADMGVPDNWILTTDNTASELRSAFQIFSQSAISVSQSADIQAIGGFGQARRLELD